MTDHVVSGLVKRRAALTGEAEALRARLAQISANLGHLDAVIRQFDPDYDIAGVRPKRRRGPDVANRGERSRALLAVLREAGEPLSTVEIVRRVMAQAGQDGEDRVLATRVGKRVGMALARQERRGGVHAVREAGRVVMWQAVWMRAKP